MASLEIDQPQQHYQLGAMGVVEPKTKKAPINVEALNRYAVFPACRELHIRHASKRTGEASSPRQALHKADITLRSFASQAGHSNQGSRLKKLFMLGAMAAVISGCSNNEDDYLDIVKCNLSAQRLSQSQALYEITRYAQEFTQDTGFLPSAEEIKKIALDGREKMGLDKLNSQETQELMVEIYNSSTCKKMHNQPEVDG